MASMMIQLQLCDGNPVLVNSDAVEFVQPTEDHTLIVLRGGGALKVSDSFDAIAELFDPERQAAEPC
jgi:uncharacterized protein YlzI (FlbEa/FlbD family)